MINNDQTLFIQTNDKMNPPYINKFSKNIEIFFSFNSENKPVRIN